MPIFLPPLLYAETHYRFKYFFSYLKKSEPEIIADLPHRIEIGKKLPVLIIVKDAHQYPVKLNQVEIYVDEIKVLSQSVSKKINSDYYDQIILLDTGSFNKGKHWLNIKIEYELKGKVYICFNDNYRGTSHKPLPCYFSDNALPCFDGYVHGETHAHTNFTSDQVEFAASVEKSAELAKALGFHFYCATDHSYDLDDLIDNYLKNDPELPKWKKFQQEVEEFNNENNDFCIIPGEEVSALNANHQNVHLLVYNSKKFYEGAGDSGEKWFNFKSKYKLPDILNDLNEKALAFAAHPTDPIPLLQRILIKRGNWNFNDALHSKLWGVQIINGGDEQSIERGLRYWCNLLLSGAKIYALAGNDGHGNFARCRKISFPFFTIREHYLHLFGIWRTCVFLGGKSLSVKSIVDSLRSGNYYMTNGPALKITAFSGEKAFEMGSCAKNIHEIQIQAKSSEEYGYMRELNIYLGEIGSGNELKLFKQEWKTPVFSWEQRIPVKEKQGKFYIRAEVKSQNDRGIFRAFSNPIWFEG